MYALALTFDSFNLQCCSVARMFSSSAGWLVVLAEFLERIVLGTKFTTMCPNPGTVYASWAGQQVQSELLVVLSVFSLGLTRWGSTQSDLHWGFEVFLLFWKLHLECRSWFHRGKNGSKSLAETVRIPWCCRYGEMIYPMHAYHGTCSSQSVRRLGFLIGSPNPELSIPNTLNGLGGSLWCTRNVDLLPSAVKCRDDSSVPQNTV